MKFNFKNYEEYEIYMQRERIKEYLIMFITVTIFFVCFLLLMGTPKTHAQELTASWYSVESLKKEGTWAYSHGRMANGHIFNDNNYTCATALFPIGTTLRIDNSVSKSFVYVKVTDRIGKRFAKTRIDLSRAAFQKLAHLKEGLIKVNVQKI
jgi:rare lipoprotein A (peptidoglycan hydrolase)